VENNMAFVGYLKNITKIENADKIVQADVVLNDIKITQVIVSVDTNENTKIVYFDSNLCLSQTLIDDYPDLGRYLAKGNRVRCLKLKGVISNGLCVNVEKFYKYFKSEEKAIKTLIEGYSFEKIDELIICKKYFPKINVEQSSSNKNKFKIKGVIKSKIIPNQWNFHKDTQHFLKNAFKLNPEHIISISSKMHGSSFIVSNCLVYKSNFLDKLLLNKFLHKKCVINVFNFINKILKFVNVMPYNIKNDPFYLINVLNEFFKKHKFLKNDKEYDYIYSSRKVIKNGVMNDEQHFYKEDVWKNANELLKGKLHKGETVYGEIVGFSKNGSPIQKHYDYGCVVGEFKLYIYRITFTNIDGVVFEYSWEQMKERCKEIGIECVPELYYGKAKHLFPELDISEHWNKNFIEKLKEKYLEKECEYCIFPTDNKLKKELKKHFNFSKVPDEGIVLRIEGRLGIVESYKMKSENFVLFENGMKDKGEIDIEEVESVEDNVETY
jgi:hypothetical protein